MTIIGMWLAIVGYGIAYAGMSKLGGGQCSIVDAFRNRCGQSAQRTSTTPPSGSTVLAARQAHVQQQAGIIESAPIPQGSTLA